MMRVLALSSGDRLFSSASGARDESCCKMECLAEMKRSGNVRIGLLEDNPSISELLTFALERDHTIMAYVFGAAFLHALHPDSELEPFDLVIVDLGLPDMPGVEVLSRIRETPATRHLPIIVLTGAPRHLIAQVASRFPDIPIVRKPFHFDDLLAAIASVMVAPALADQAHQQTEAVE